VARRLLALAAALVRDGKGLAADCKRGVDRPSARCTPRLSLRQGQHAFEALAPLSALALLRVRGAARSFHPVGATAADRTES